MSECSPEHRIEKNTNTQHSQGEFGGLLHFKQRDWMDIGFLTCNILFLSFGKGKLSPRQQLPLRNTEAATGSNSAKGI